MVKGSTARTADVRPALVLNPNVGPRNWTTTERSRKGVPDGTEVGVHCNAVTVAGVPVTGVTVSEAVAELPFSVAVTVTA